MAARARSRSGARSSFRSAGPTAATAASGGDVWIEAADGLNTLIDYRYQQHFKGGTGGHGMGQNRHGADGETHDAESADRHASARRRQGNADRRSDQAGHARAAGARRQWRLRQRPFQIVGEPGAAPRQSRPRRRRAHVVAAAEADRRRRADRFAERRQVDVPARGERGDAEGGRLSVHDVASASWAS